MVTCKQKVFLRVSHILIKKWVVLFLGVHVQTVQGGYHVSTVSLL